MGPRTGDRWRDGEDMSIYTRREREDREERTRDCERTFLGRGGMSEVGTGVLISFWCLTSGDPYLSGGLDVGET